MKLGTSFISLAVATLGVAGMSTSSTIDNVESLEVALSDLPPRDLRNRIEQENYCFNSPLKLRLKNPKEDIFCHELELSDCRDSNQKRRKQIRTHCSLKCQNLLKLDTCKCDDSSGLWFFEQTDRFHRCTSNFAKNNCHKRAIARTCPDLCNLCPDSPSSFPSSMPSPEPALIIRTTLNVSGSGSISLSLAEEIILKTLLSFLPEVSQNDESLFAIDSSRSQGQIDTTIAVDGDTSNSDVTTLQTAIGTGKFDKRLETKADKEGVSLEAETGVEDNSPSDSPSEQPSLNPSEQPSLRPSMKPSMQPSNQPSLTPSDKPSQQPSSSPSDTPSDTPSDVPSDVPSDQPSSTPSDVPSAAPSDQPSLSPSDSPSSSPSSAPSTMPSAAPSDEPSLSPTDLPSQHPSSSPSDNPSGTPSDVPSDVPSDQPSSAPSDVPSAAPSDQPSLSPSYSPSDQPSLNPSNSPSQSIVPSNQPSLFPSEQPSLHPSTQPSLHPSTQPSTSNSPSDSPSEQPSLNPSEQPSLNPSTQPSLRPSMEPSMQPSNQPSSTPSDKPSQQPSSGPSDTPSDNPSDLPSNVPSLPPSNVPSAAPSDEPSLSPSILPSQSTVPSSQPSLLPSTQPSLRPSTSLQPSIFTWTQMGDDIDGEAANDYSGYSVSLSDDGSIVAIGAYRNTNGNGQESGHVRVYELIGTTWTHKGDDIDGEAADDYSGYSVSLSDDGTVVAIGAEDNDNGNGSNSGHVRVYEFTGTGWTQKGDDIDGEAANDYSGHSVSLSGDGTTVAIGAYGNDGNCPSAGHVRVYEFTGTAWSKKGDDLNGEAAYDRSGQSVSLSDDGTVVAIGAEDNDNGNGTNSGHVRVYEFTGTGWTQKGDDIDGEAAFDWSGSSVSLSNDGTIVAIGAYGNDNGNGEDSGHVRVYEFTGASWTKKGDDIDGEAAYDRSGYSVSLSGDGTVVAIGAYFNDDGNESDSGHVRVYEFTGASWTKKGDDIDGEAAFDRSGYSVSLSGDGAVVAIGAYRNDNGNGSDSGHLRLYGSPGWEASLPSSTPSDSAVPSYLPSHIPSYQPSHQPSHQPSQAPSIFTWIQMGSDIDGEGASDRSGASVSLSGDGTVVAIGAYLNDNGNGLDAGHVRVYEFTGAGWTQKGDDIDGESVFDWSGFSVALSDDGIVVAIGAYKNRNGNGSPSGHVRVYEFNGTAWTKKGDDINGEGASDYSGYSVSLSDDGTVVAIGAYRNDNDNGEDSGHVRVYEFTGASWTKKGDDIDGEAAGDYSGQSVSLSGDGAVVAIGAPHNDNGNGEDSGHVRVYEFTGASWTKKGDDIDGEAAGDHSGQSVSLSGDGAVVAIGAPHNDNDNGEDSGHVRVYEFTGTGWTQKGADIKGETASDRSGRSVSLSNDGTIVAIGADGNDNGNGSDSGHVRVYEFTGASWTLKGDDIDGEAANDNSGHSVSLSGDGTTVAIGAPYNDNGNGSNSGHVRVYG